MPATPAPRVSDDLLNDLAERLRVSLGAEPSARELAEALWLARHVADADVRQDEPQEPVEPQLSDAGHTPLTWSPPDAPATAPGATTLELPDRTRLYADQPGPARRTPVDAPDDDSLVRVHVPMATALPHSLGLQRALRPLQRYHPPVRTPAHRIDEQATAERAAETRLLLPVLRADARREARLRLLMDASTSTAVWDSTLEELAQICAGLGAFREVPVHYVHEGADGRLGVGTSRNPDAQLRAAEQLRDPTGRQLTLVLSDCAGPLWRSGQMQRLLHHWGQVAPVALLQPLPQRMWRRTHLPALPGRLRRREGLGARLEFTPADGSSPPGALPVPVLSPTRTALGVWARLLSGSTGLSLPGAAAWVHAAHPASPPRPAHPAADAETLVAAFRRTASRQATSLAVAFSAVPLTLPVMQLVQRAMQPRSGPTVLAEVLLSGLLERGPEEGWYEFRPGVRELLLQLLAKGDALLVLKHCGEYVERYFGRRARNFPALALARLSGVEPPLEGVEAVPEAFAEVSALVVGRYGVAPPPEQPVQRETVEIVYTAAETPWVTWLTYVLASCGHEVNWRKWGDAVRLDAVLGRLRDRHPERPVLLLVGDCYEGSGDAWLDFLDRFERNRQFITVDVQSALPFRFSLPRLTLSHAGEALARWRLLKRLGIPQSAYAPGTRQSPPFPDPARIVRGEVPARTPGYVYRQELLGQLREKLTSRHHRSAACALVGSSASGKSQLAAEYVHRHGDEYDIVWWVRADDRSARVETLAEFASELVPAPESRERVGELLRDLGAAGLSWLVVLDGWDDPEDASDLLLSGGHVLITSRDTRWAQKVDTLRMGSTATHEPFVHDADREELVRRAVVRVDAPGTPSGARTGSGFFLAPGWVVTCASVVGQRQEARGPDGHSAVGVTTMDGQRYRVEQVREVGDLALLRVPGAVDPDCLWLTDKPHVPIGEATLYGTTGPTDAPRMTTVSVAMAGELGRDVLRVSAERVPPPAASGSPVIDQRDGELIGVVLDGASVDGEARVRVVRIAALRALCASGDEGAGLWHSIVRAHDRHHAERFRTRGSNMTWTGLQTWLAARWSAVGKLSSVQRTELYEILAGLPPPGSPDMVSDLLGERGVDRYRPYSWRDGVGHLPRGDWADLALMYAARLWVRLADHPDADWSPALARLRAWVTDNAQHKDEARRRAVAAVLARAETASVSARASVLVEIERTDTGALAWRVLLVRDGESADMAGGAPVPLSEVEVQLRPHLAAALLHSDFEGATPSVQFSLPPGLLWNLRVESWRLSETSPALGDECHVFVRSHDRVSQSRSRERKARWEGVARGPLQDVRMTSLDTMTSPAATRDLYRRLSTAPLTAVPVGCLHGRGSVDTGLDSARALGFPLILWSRAPLHAVCGNVYEWTEELLRQSGTARELLARIRNLRVRSAAGDPDAAWSQHLAVYYDPPGTP
ncbi:SAV_2336 N-terminal domain-related protein [Streptomyces sp. 2A115]|uniref:SAV_2336 N-terminal domain-related protein n=1 Tax=Streptomyces sp. 2A115 TaxID=3457439 RepID=UPI003FD670D8